MRAINRKDIAALRTIVWELYHLLPLWHQGKLDMRFADTGLKRTRGQSYVSARFLPAGFLIRDTYTVIRHLGSGAFGDVYLARHRHTGGRYSRFLSVPKALTLLKKLTC